MIDTATTRNAGAAALSAADFDWAMHLDSVWSDSPYDVPDLNHKVRETVIRRLQLLATQSSSLSPLGWVIIGSGGTGKTHLLSCLRSEAHDRQMPFILVDMTDVHDFWDTVLLGYINSLQQFDASGSSQNEVVLQRILARLAHQQPAVQPTTNLRTADPAQLGRETRTVLSALHRLQPNETMSHQDVVRALVALNSDDFTTASIGLSWLQAHPVEPQDQRTLGLKVAHKEAIDIVRGLSWIMSVAGPTVLAFDQLDPIVSQLNIAYSANETEQLTEEVVVAKTIIESISRGLGALRDVTRRTLTVISCLEPTWETLDDKSVLRSNTARFEPPQRLKAIQHGAVAEAVVRARLAPAYRAAQFQPPYNTWPFRADALQAVRGLSPRQLLQLCYAHRDRCLHDGHVAELTEFEVNATPSAISGNARPFTELDDRFERYRAQADLQTLLDESAGEERFAPLLQVACRSLIDEHPPAPGVEASVDIDFGKDLAKAPLHARLRIKYTDEGDREEHFCVRAVQRAHPSAFQARLRAAMTQSGIDRRLDFRRMAIVRTTKLPGGPVTVKLVTQFLEAGGKLANPGEDELRTLWALWKMHQDKLADFPAWLRERKPASGLTVMEQAVVLLSDRHGKSAQRPSERDEAAGTRTLGNNVVVGRSRSTTSPLAVGRGREAPGNGVSAKGSRKILGNGASPDTQPTAKKTNQSPSHLIPDNAGSANTVRETAGNSTSPRPNEDNPSRRAPTRDDRANGRSKAESPSPAVANLTERDNASGKSSTPRTLTLGRRVIAGTPQEPATTDAGKLSEHTLVLAGSGAGKTVLVRRLIEEVALLGIPSIVIDCANDLATLGDRWPTPPQAWDHDDRARAERYHNDVEVAVWTPGKRKGNPMTFEPLPDLAAVADDEDELNDAVGMVTESLRSVLAPGNGAAAKNKIGILTKALKYFAAHGGKSLKDLAALLADLPGEAGLGVEKESKYAQQMSDSLLVEMEIDPLLGGAGTGIDPAVLFGDVPEATKTRISIINFAFLASLHAQQKLLNQLAMTLFTWIKKHPVPPDNRPLRGLLVIDEARDYVPSVKSTVCKSSLMQLVAQARKYGLGIVFATQGPVDIDNKIVSNCAIKYLGKASAPPAIKVITHLIQQSGGKAAKVAALGKGCFYRCGANGSQPPTKVQMPICLSHHAENPLTTEEILARAVASRQPVADPGAPPLPPINTALETAPQSV